MLKVKENSMAPSSQQSARRGGLASEEYAVKAMPPILGTFDMTAIYLMVIFYITNVTTAIAGGAATFTYWVLGGITFFIPSVIATAQLAVMFPHEGSLYNWTHKAFGGYWSFFVAFCAWFPGVLVIVSGADIVVSHIQGLNSQWLVPPWQQGIVLICVIIFSGVLAVQRFRTVQNIVNVVICLLFLGVFLIGLAGGVWLATGHASATSFTHLSDWLVKPADRVNLSVFGLITFAYLGMEVPMNMGGEITGRHVIRRHMLWGTLLVIIGYLVATFSVLVIEGPSANGNTFALVSAVDMALGKGVGDIVAVCIMISFVMAAVVYNYAWARLLFVASVDQRLPMRVGKLNKYRVPANAIIFQTVVAVIFVALAFLLVPYVIRIGNPADLTNEVYNVSQAAATLIWVTSTGFLFANLLVLYLRDRQSFHRQRVFPMPVLWVSVVLGPIACVIAIIDTLLNSWIQQINNTQWLYVVGGITFVCLVFAAIGSILASSEAAWQEISR